MLICVLAELGARPTGGSFVCKYVFCSNWYFVCLKGGYVLWWICFCKYRYPVYKRGSSFGDDIFSVIISTPEAGGDYVLK
jgi:hypothetical protein